MGPRYNRGMSLYTPKPGRPRQPWCPDCKKQIPPVYNEKAPGQGYCGAHQSQRVRKNYIARRNAANPNFPHPETRERNLQKDIRDNLAKGMPLTVEMIKTLYHENALPTPSDEDIRKEFFPETIGPEYENLIDMAEQDRLVAELQKQAREANPYDPVD